MYPQSVHPPRSDGDQIIRNMRAMHEMGVPLITDERLLQRFGIPRAADRRGGGVSQSSTGGNTEGNSIGVRNEPAPSPSAYPSWNLNSVTFASAVSPPASSATVAGRPSPDPNDANTGALVNSALYVWHGDGSL